MVNSRVVWKKATAHCRRDPQQREEFRCDLCRGKSHWLSHAGESQLRTAKRGDLFTELVLASELHVIAIYQRWRYGKGKIRRHVRQHVQPVRFCKGQRTQEHAIDDGEHRCVHPDTEGERQYCDGGEPRIAANQAKSITRIGPQLVPKANAHSRAARVLGSLHPAKLQAS